jgi:uncharacterized coiled-coil DUF342 family protein
MADDERAQISKLTSDLETANEYIESLEAEWKEHTWEIKEKQKLLAECKAQLEKAKEENREQDKHIKAVEQQVKDANDKIDERDVVLARTREMLEDSRAATKAATDRAEGIKQQYDGVVEDNRGIRAKCQEINHMLSAANSKLTSLEVQAIFFKESADDIRLERAKNKSLHQQISELKQDIKTLGFNPDASAYRKNIDALAQQPKTLNDELAAVESSSDVGSDGEDDMLGYSPLPVLPQLPPPEPEKVVEYITRTVHVDRPVYVDRPIKVTVFVDRPFQVSAHNPVTCWFLVELNMLILFLYWLQQTLYLFAKILKKAAVAAFVKTSGDLGSSKSTSQMKLSKSTPQKKLAGPQPSPPPNTTAPAEGESNVPVQEILDRQEALIQEGIMRVGAITPAPATPAIEGPSGHEDGHELSDEQIIHDEHVSDDQVIPDEHTSDDQVMHVEHEVPNDQVIHINQGEPVSASPGTSYGGKPLTTPQQIAQAPSAQSSNGKPAPKPKVWSWRTFLKLDPSTLPSVRHTLIGAAFHLIVYIALAICCDAYYEREVWLAANDQTRAFVHQLLTQPGVYRTGFARFFSVLPEDWKRNIDILMWRNIVLRWGMQVSYQMPG